MQVCVVGPGFHFMSGLSIYTCGLANALAQEHEVSVIRLQKLIPAALYPGGHRSGHDLTTLEYDPAVQVITDMDWYWGRPIGVALNHLRTHKPDLLVLQWWTAATLHTYLALSTAARRLGIPVVLEFHETQDSGEAAMPMVARYFRRTMPMLLARTSGALIHNDHDVAMIDDAFGAVIGTLAVQIAPLAPFDHLPVPAVGVATGDGPTRLLFFGLIRPYKGLEDLIAAFDAMSPEQAAQFTLTVVGETWEKWTVPAELIAASRYRDRITFVNRYVTDVDAAQYFADADAVVLPYRRGSASGPLQIAMNAGLHVVLYAVGGLVEAVRDYPGARLVAPQDIDGLRDALLELPAVRLDRFQDPHSWLDTVNALEALALELSPR
jgi:glycosyltransferase involved in cell wall biosynthesis